MQLPLFLIPIVVGLFAQAIKPLFNRGWYAHKIDEGGYLPRYGGMPSAHTAFAFSLATLVGFMEGWGSVPFAIAFTVLLFVIDDALRMRIFLGRHGEALRGLIAKLPKQEQVKYPHMEARLGHKPAEVVAGAILGSIVTWLLLAALGII